ncbi:sulfite oxidase [Aquihabitans sp. McL0605]|uniref:sulfite oxidase n=1 Tax=Aquihabitans sp. McL0605 TaxID=3415671 RepID=UPI003CF1C1CF
MSVDAAAPQVAPAPEQEGIGWRGAVAGALGAATALAVIEVLSLLDSTGDSVTEATGNSFIDAFAASLKEIAVQWFGTNDKAALLIGTAVISMLIGAALGTQALTRPLTVYVGFGAFAALGIVTSLDDPLASPVVSILSSVLGALAGVGVTIGLSRRWLAAEHREEQAPVAAAGLARRTVVVDGSIAAAALLFGVGIARSIKASAREVASRVTVALPRATPKVRVPAATLDKGAEQITGISPYVTPTKDFYRIDTLFRAPVVNEANWKLTIGGMVQRELTFTYDELLARPLVEVPITMQCVSNEVGGDLIGTARWTGIPLAKLLEEAGVDAKAEQVIGESVDGFTAGFPVEVALDGRDAMLVLGMNGRTLPAEHGFPARLVVPGLYGYVSATKWLKEIRLTTWDEEGYWIPRGWSRLGPIKTSSRIDVPAGGSVAAGRQAIAGVAWAPHRGIDRVEVQVDHGPWQRATLGPTASDDTWVQWWLDWDAPSGDHRIRVRATDGTGKTQTAQWASPEPDGATGYHSIGVTVE